METARTFRIEFNDVLANDERAVAPTPNRGERLGRTLVYDEATVFRVTDGKIGEAWLYVDDQEAHAAFFR